MGRVAFAHPPHPSELVVKKQPISDAQAGHITSERLLTPEEPTSDRHDVHSLPSFDVQTLKNRREPTLYLPPLLSSLPTTHESLPLPKDNPPLITEARLPEIDQASLSLHKALHKFRPFSSDYAATGYAQAFNWSELELPEDEEREWYCVVFRSKRQAGSDGSALYGADKMAHEEAVRNGGLILYWYGIPNPETGMNLATCIWQSKKHAMEANTRPHHAEAMKLAASSYEVYALERHVLKKEKGFANVTVEEYRGGEVGF